MNIARIEWHFEQGTLLPLVRVCATTTELSLKPLLLSKAVDLIEKAYKFDGVPALSHEIPNHNQTLMVSFTLTFKNHKRAQEFLQTLK